jgi:GDP-L-fucose synthase
MRNYAEDGHINVGTGEDQSIRELAEEIRDVVAPGARLVFDATKPDGTPRKLMDVGRLAALGWRASTPLEQGVRLTYEWFLANLAALRR